MKRQAFLSSVFVVLIAFLSGCASSQIKARKEAREKAAQSGRLWCEFVNGEIFPDVDVALNIEMTKRCDPDKNFSVTSYRTPSENQGVIYCCATRAGDVGNTPTTGMKADTKKEAGSKDQGDSF
jgi:hypothetical protein